MTCSHLDADRMFYQNPIPNKECSFCKRCPPHPADVPEQFADVITQERVKSILKKMVDTLRGGLIYD